MLCTVKQAGALYRAIFHECLKIFELYDNARPAGQGLLGECRPVGPVGLFYRPVDEVLQAFVWADASNQ
ncbi:hypothetical protein GCM10027046_13350 [Uliginosibacterium flavum]